MVDAMEEVRDHLEQIRYRSAKLLVDIEKDLASPDEILEELRFIKEMLKAAKAAAKEL